MQRKRSRTGLDEICQTAPKLQIQTRYASFTRRKKQKSGRGGPARGRGVDVGVAGENLPDCTGYINGYYICLMRKLQGKMLDISLPAVLGCS